MRDAKLLPIHAVIRLRLAQVQQQAMAQFAHRHGRFLREIFQHRRRRRVAQQIKRCVARTTRSISRAACAPFRRCAGATKKLHGEAVARRLLVVRLHAADDAQRGARRVEQRQRGRRQPVFQFLDEAHFLLGLLGPGKTVGAGVHLQFGRHGTFGAQKQKRQFLQARLALGVQQARPPVGVGKIAARERQLFKIILERQPRALRIGARRENFQDVLAPADGGPWSRRVRGANRRTRRRFATAPCGARRISSCPPAAGARFRFWLKFSASEKNLD
jgi:hypothetical protein